MDDEKIEVLDHATVTDEFIASGEEYAYKSYRLYDEALIRGSLFTSRIELHNGAKLKLRNGSKLEIGGV